MRFLVRIEARKGDRARTDLSPNINPIPTRKYRLVPRALKSACSSPDFRLRSAIQGSPFNGCATGCLLPPDHPAGHAGRGEGPNDETLPDCGQGQASRHADPHSHGPLPARLRSRLPTAVATT